jgi:superoxide dismutase
MSLIVESAEKSRERKEKVKSKCAKSDTERKLLPGQEDLADEQQKWLDKQPYP